MTTFEPVPESRPLRMVFLGCGGITARHAGLLRRWPGVECAFASRSADRARTYQHRFRGAACYASYQAALEDPAVDAVFVATPPDSHLPLAEEALRQGKHVIVEKPPFLSTADFDRVAALARNQRRQLMVAENYFYKPLRQALLSVLSRPDIGTLRFLVANAAKRQRTGDWRDEAATAGGGALFEGGIHWVSLLGNLGLEVRRVSGFRPGPTDPAAPERAMQVVVEYADGPVATLLYAWDVPGILNGLRLSSVYGTAGAVTFESNGLFLLVRGHRLRLVFPGFRDITGVRAMFRDFLRALHTGLPPAYDMDTARRDLLHVEQACRAADETPHIPVGPSRK
jgi:UDP-N-acetylglucosamine 3-dehydrogenase